MTNPLEILVFSEDIAFRQELLGKARQVADRHGGYVTLLLPGVASPDDATAYAAAGADRLCLVEGAGFDHYQTDTYTGALAGAIKQLMPKIVLVGATKRGFEIAPAVAERLQAGYASWVLDFEIEPESDRVCATCMIYSGIGTATYRFGQSTTLLTAAPGVFNAVTSQSRDLQVETLRLELPAPVATVVEYKPKAEVGARLEDASYVIDVGQGVKQPDDLALVESLAGKLGGQLACTRPLASDRDWFPEWLGLSGKKIRPRLCLTLGVSGAIQHVIGIRDSKVIATVNNDENAGIFTQADYGVVADLYEFLPVLMERMASRGITPV